ncbi:hypothetical protein EIP91_003438 [Steccherinum ochraceum]|uniref:G-protein coupled receptors family 1 profile domain-containing protein n=1 Tax=Steccherinum ochraceum TaxID=92696 RepID=A0A4R0RBZ4_9APHY|nr:hypothetical protein EIP91_003438 [Steccherinum ochraceum]
MSGEIVTKFQDGEQTGLIAVIVCAVFSFLAINFVWIRMVYTLVSARWKNEKKVSKYMPEHVFFRTQLGGYIASLLLSNAISCVGSMINATWVEEAGITIGSVCTTQGATIQIGDLATAYFTAAIAVHTFCTLALKNRLPYYCAWIAIALGWSLTGVSGIIPSVLPNHIFGTDGAMCGIALHFPAVQLLVHLVPVLAATLIASVFYALVFLNVRGTLVFKGSVRFNFHPEERWRQQDEQAEYVKFVAAVAKSMLIFPIVYIILMTPHIIISMIETSGRAAPFSAKVFAVSCAVLLGVFNVMVLYNTLRIMGPGYFGHSSQRKDVESFSSSEDKSPVDVAPSVSAVLAQRAFPSPRALTPRQLSMASEADSTAHLLAPGHAYTNSDASLATMSTLDRSITPVKELNANLIPNAPMTPRIKVESASSDSDDSSGSSLPTPRRPGLKKPHLRRPSFPAAIQIPAYPEYIVENGMLSAVNLGSAGPKKPERKKKDRDSFLNMYSSRSPSGPVSVQGPTPPDRGNRPLGSPSNFGEHYDISSFTSPRAAPVAPLNRNSTASSESSPEPYSARPDLDVPLSPFAASLIERATKSPEHGRSHSEVVSPTRTRSAKEPRKTDKKEKRRSKSLDIVPRRGIPEVIRPGTPLSTRAKELLPTALSGPHSADFVFPPTPPTRGTPTRGTPRTPARPSKLRSAALPTAPLQISAVGNFSPQRVTPRRLPKTPAQVQSSTPRF